MNIVRGALRRPITVLVAVLALAMAAGVAVVDMPRDILPSLGIPTIYVAQPYGGLSPAQMESYVTYYYEYHFLYITGIRHVESKNIASAALIKLEFYPGTDMAAAEAETVANVSRSRAFMPPGTVPPFVVRFDAGNAPVGNLVFTAKNRSLGELQNLALNSVRPLFATLKGVSAPPPFGASARTIVVDVDPAKMRRYDLSASAVAEAIAKGNVLTPAGNLPVGDLYPIVPVNSVVSDFHSLLGIPLRIGTVPTVYLKDIGTVEDTTDIPTSYALVNGQRTVYIPVTKRADASTVAVVDLVRKNIPRFEAVVPKDVKISYEFDQSVYVRQAITSLFLEGLIGAGLTGLMVLLFLRDLRAVVIVLVNIPLSLLASLLAMWICGQTMNVMTLGGLALAVGILVDETVVTIENIHTHLAQGATVARAALEATTEILKPSLLTLLCILSVFVPSFFMEGVAKAMFVPLTLAVGFAMVGSFVLSVTLAPVLSSWILKGHRETRGGRFGRFRDRYAGGVRAMLRHRKKIVGAFVASTIACAGFMAWHIGREIFPIVSQGQLKLRIRAPTGTRLDATEKVALRVLDLIEREVGRSAVRKTLAFVGMQPPEYPVNDIYQWSSGTYEALIQVALEPKADIDVTRLQENLRRRIGEALPNVELSFEPAGLIDAMMSQGSPTPIEIAVNGPDIATDRDFARKLRAEIAGLPYLRDLQFGQVYEYPAIDVHVDRPQAGARGVTAMDVGRAVIPATSSTRFIIPLFWSDPKNGINYQVQVQVPQGRVSSIAQIERLPVTVAAGAVSLGSVATVKPGTEIGEYDRFDMERMVSLTANLEGMDLGHAAAQLRERLAPLLSRSPRGVEVHFRGQVASLTQMFDGLTKGLLLAIIVIFLLLAGNFESFPLALAVLATIPAVLSGALGLLLATGTRLNIESFMGAIMAIGVAVANSVLLVTFAERHRLERGDAEQGAIEGAASRLRPILMTSLAMIMGMVPMSLGLGEGGKETAPLGRAVIGGLLGSTVATLLIVPLIFAIVRAKRGTRSASLDPDDARGARFEEQKGKLHERPAAA